MKSIKNIGNYLTRGTLIVAVAGLLTSTDLLRGAAQGPVAMLRGVEGLPSRQSPPGYGRRLAEMCGALLTSGIEPTAIAGLVARLRGR